MSKIDDLFTTQDERDGAVAVDVVNASREKLSIPESEQFQERISTCDLLLENEVGADQLWAFSTCSYQTWNSRTIVFATAV